MPSLFHTAIIFLKKTVTRKTIRQKQNENKVFEHTTIKVYRFKLPLFFVALLEHAAVKLLLVPACYNKIE